MRSFSSVFPLLKLKFWNEFRNKIRSFNGQQLAVTVTCAKFTRDNLSTPRQRQRRRFRAGSKLGDAQSGSFNATFSDFRKLEAKVKRVIEDKKIFTIIEFA